MSCPKDHNLAKEWFVDYSIWSERRQTLVRKRVLLKGETVEQRLADGKEVVKELLKVLKKGACIEPMRQAPAEPQPTETPPKPQSVTLKTPLTKAITIYLEYKKQTTKYNSWRTYRSNLRAFLNYLNTSEGMKNVPLGNFHAVDALHFLDHLILQEGRTNRGYNNVKDTASGLFLHWAERLNHPGQLTHLVNPFDKIPDKRTVSNKHTAYTDAQREQFKQLALQHEEQQLLLFVQFMYYTFLRPREELRPLRVQDIKEQTIYVTGGNAKDNDGEYVQIPPGLERLLIEYKIRSYPPHYYVFSHSGKPGPQPVGRDYFYQHHRRLLQKMDYGHLSHDTYSWKHTGVIALWNATQNIRLIQNQCRHATAAQTEDYLRDLGIIVRQTQIDEFPDF